MGRSSRLRTSSYQVTRGSGPSRDGRSGGASGVSVSGQVVGAIVGASFGRTASRSTYPINADRTVHDAWFRLPGDNSSKRHSIQFSDRTGPACELASARKAGRACRTLQNYQCEPAIINGGWHGGQYFAGTHLPVAEHQARTVANLLHLRGAAPDLPFVPVLQGFTLDDYQRCADLYDRAGIDLSAEPLVGLGSVCRRQGTREVHRIVTALRGRGIARLHGFGVKALGLDLYGDLIASADSLAWSIDARRLARPSPWCTDHRTAKNCASCLAYALAWRERTILPRLAAFEGT